MLKHIVMWQLKDQAEGRSKAENAATMKAMLTALPATVPGVRELWVSTEVTVADPATDIVLFTAFDDEAALKAYAGHPDHLVVVEFIKKVAAVRRVVDVLV